MRSITKVRVAMMILWLCMMFIQWDIVWFCLFSENEPGLQRGIIGSTIVSLCPICLSGMFTLTEYINKRIPIEE